LLYKPKYYLQMKLNSYIFYHIFTDSSEQPRSIVASVSSGLSQEASAAVGSGTAIKKAISRHRNKVQGIPRNVTNAADIAVPAEYKLTSDGRNFLLHDSGEGDPDRLLLFGTEESLDWLVAREHWFSDGTFKTCPEVFYQLYTIHILFHHTVIPAVYVLTQKKDEGTYTRILEIIKSLRPQVNPKTIMMDFEQAARKAAKRTFTTCDIHGCLFHLGQSLFRKIQAEGLATQFSNDETFRLFCKMLLSLSFLPPAEVVDAFEMLTGHPTYDHSEADRS
jgi:hypothetical protein